METPNNRPPTIGPPPFVGIERAFQRKKGEGGVLRSLLSRPRRRRRPLMSVCLASEGDGSKKKNDRRGRESGLLHGGRRPRARGPPPRPCRVSFALVYSSRRRHRLEAGDRGRDRGTFVIPLLALAAEMRIVLYSCSSTDLLLWDTENGAITYGSPVPAHHYSSNSRHNQMRS